MIGSLISGLSGVRSNQTMLEVIGNNIANANTIGYKSSRATFSDILSRTLRSGSAVQAPMQIGRGVQVAAIANLIGQGGIQETTRESDVAIQGRGFFIVSDGRTEFFTRAGSFTLNESGELVTLDGFHVQGFNAVGGRIPPTATTQNIAIPQGPIPPRATSLIGVTGNLDAGTKVFAVDVNGRPIRIGGLEGFIGTPMSGSVSLEDTGTTLTLSAQGVNFDNATNATPPRPLAIGDRIIVDGRILTVNNLDAAANTITVDRPQISGTIEVQQGSNTVVGTDTAFKTELRVGDTILVDGNDVRIVAIESDTRLTVAAPVANAVAAGTQLSFGQTAGLVAVSGARAELAQAPEGTLKLFQLPLTDFPITQEEVANIAVNDLQTGRQIVVSANGTNTLAEFEQAVQRAGFTDYTLNDPRFRLGKLDQANAAVTSFRAIDSQGTTHHAVVTFFKTDADNTWIWRVQVPDADGTPQDEAFRYTENSQGTVQFNEDGTIKSFKNAIGAEQFTLTFRANPDADPLAIQLNVDAVRSLTQFNLQSDVAVSRNNGTFSGEFQTFTVQRDGTLLGTFSNGEVRVVGQIVLADFANPAGLARAGSSLFGATDNSGEPIRSIPGEGSMGAILSGALELSNVAIAEEFTSLILAQRGFQASANVITTTDSLMNEVLNLKRA
jgi:flagellar hook protein FlgE